MGGRSDVIGNLFPGRVIVEEEVPSHWRHETAQATNDSQPWLYPEEEESVARAVPKRRQEFTAGRICARRALEKLGIAPRALPPKPDRSPPWPVGVVGSITHTADWCGVVVARATDFRAVGIDAESEEPIDPDLFRRICTARELSWLASQPFDQQGVLGRTIFSAKEAFYKAQYLETGQFLGFHDVELNVDLSEGRFTAVFQVPAAPRFEPGDHVEGRIRVVGGLIVSVAWIV